MAAAALGLFSPWYAHLPLWLFAALELVRFLTQRARWIAFDETGVEGSRWRGLSVHDLHRDRTYLLGAARRGRKVVAAAEAHGYAVVARPPHARV